MLHLSYQLIKQLGFRKKIGTSRVKGRPKSFIEKGSRKRRHPCGETPVTSTTINIPASLSVDYTQVTQVIFLHIYIYSVLDL